LFYERWAQVLIVSLGGLSMAFPVTDYDKFVDVSVLRWRWCYVGADTVLFYSMSCALCLTGQGDEGVG